MVQNTQRLNESNFTDWNIERVLNSIRCLFGSHSSNGCFGSLFSPHLCHAHWPARYTHNFLSFSFCTRVSVCGWMCVSVMKWPCVIFFRILFSYFNNVVVCAVLPFFHRLFFAFFSELTSNTFTWFFVIVIGYAVLHSLFLFRQTDQRKIL